MMMRIAEEEDRAFQELRRKIREARVLCPSVESLLEGVGFTGRLSVVVQNGKILKSGYEEGYFTRRQDERVVN
jgi:sulfur carrier protein ThiS